MGLLTNISHSCNDLIFTVLIKHSLLGIIRGLQGVWNGWNVGCVGKGKEMSLERWVGAE